MARLIIPLPSDVKSGVRSCVVLLALDGNSPLISTLIMEGNSGDAYIAKGCVYFVLQQSHTPRESLRVQLECYSDPMGECFIARSGISEQILFEPALADSLEDLPEAQSDPDAISELIGILPQLRTLLKHPGETIYATEGVHGIRFHDGRLQGNDGSGWMDIYGSGPPPTGPARWNGKHKFNGAIRFGSNN